MAKNKIKKIAMIAGSIIGGIFVASKVIRKINKRNSTNQDNSESENPFVGKKVIFAADENDKMNADGKKGHLESVGDIDYQPRFYEKSVKRAIDVVLSLGGLIVLSPVYLIVALAIVIEDPGPVFFTQKRLGQNKKYFKLHKFRSMKMCTPHDVPTHMLDNPEQYITRVGRFIRNHSIDELPQVYDILVGNMSVIGPRPGLWNQDILIAERDKYGANNVKPGLTGWAQINGRDELEIPDKAKLDGEYVKKIGLLMDVKCFLGSVGVFHHDSSVVEGGTGEMVKQQESNCENSSKILVVCQYYYPENFQITPICEQLAKDGYEVTVLTGLPNYPKGEIPEKYKNGHRDEVINDVHVIRCFEIPRGKGIIKLGLNYLSYSLAASKRVTKLQKDFDLVFVYQLSPVLMGLPGMKYAKKNNVPLFLYCCDLWPESMKMYIKNENNPAYKIIKAISKKIYNSADLVAGQSTSFIPYLKETHKLHDEKLVYMPAFADETYLETDFLPENDVTDFVFLGNLGIAQNLPAVLDAINQIKNVKNIKVHFVGDGTCLNDMKQYVKENDLTNIVEFYGRRPVEEMLKFYKLADACLVSLKADGVIGLTLPSKVQGYMAAGKPIIGMIDGSAKKVINESKCGICVDAGDITGLATAMKDFAEHREQYSKCGESGRQYFIKNFSKDILMKKLEDEFNNLIRR